MRGFVITDSSMVIVLLWLIGHTSFIRSEIVEEKIMKQFIQVHVSDNVHFLVWKEDSW